MKPILDKFKLSQSSFRPKTAADLFALRLACKLGESAAASHYAHLADKYSEAQMINAFRRSIRISKAQDIGKRFHVELGNVPSEISNGNGAHLIAIRVERRSIAAAVFYGERLEYCQVRQLPSDKDKVVASAIRFVIWMASQFHLDSAAVESIPDGNEIQRRVLTDAIVKALRERLLPIWEVTKQDLFRAYGYPPLKSRKELREVIIEVWPVLMGTNSKSFIQDAAALGLYVQVERLFLH
jgi:hypothetical protein